MEAHPEKIFWPLKQRLMDDLKQALKGGDKLKQSVIQLVMAAIKNAEIARQAK